MRDEALAEIVDDMNILVLRVYCHEAIRHGDRTLSERNPEFDNAPLLVHFQSSDSRFNTLENRGTMLKHK